MAVVVNRLGALAAAVALTLASTEGEAQLRDCGLPAPPEVPRQTADWAAFEDATTAYFNRVDAFLNCQRDRRETMIRTFERSFEIEVKRLRREMRGQLELELSTIDADTRLVEGEAKLIIRQLEETPSGRQN